MAFDPYLFFGGNCREAFTRYEEIFGGELQLITMADTPDGEDVPADQADLILHAALTRDGRMLMGSDDPTTDDFGPVQGMMVSYSASDADDARTVFDGAGRGRCGHPGADRDVLLARLRDVRRPLRHALDGQRLCRGRLGRGLTGVGELFAARRPCSRVIALS